MTPVRPRVAVVHGYFLGESGSEIYARELARAFVSAGCDVTLICQEPDAASIDFVDEAWQLTEGNRELERVLTREALGPGTCRLVRPNLDGEILVYAPGARFPGYVATPLQDASAAQIVRFVDANTTAMRTVFERWPPAFVQANHLVMQPVAAARALAGSPASMLTTFHGSELTFSLSADPRLAPYAEEAISASNRVVCLSEWSRQQLTEYAAGAAIELGDRIVEVPPGVDTALFAPVDDRDAVLHHLLGDEGSEAQDEIITYAGALRRTKGVHHVLVAFARILATRPHARLLLAGAGPYTEQMRRLAGRIGALAGNDSYSKRVHFLGHLPHPRLAPLLGSTDVALVPSVIPEAFALVAIEAASAGAVPVAPFHTGMRTPIGAIADYLEDPRLTGVEAGRGLSRSLAEEAARILDRYPTRDRAFREGLHAFIDERFSWKACAAQYLSLAGIPVTP